MSLLGLCINAAPCINASTRWMLVLAGSDREQGERGSGLGASDRRTRSMVYSATDKSRRRKRRCAKSQRTSLFLSFLDPSKPKPTKTTKNKIPSQRPNEATRKKQFPQKSRISLSSFVSYTRPQSTRPVWIKKKISSKLKIRRHFSTIVELFY